MSECDSCRKHKTSDCPYLPIMEDIVEMLACAYHEKPDHANFADYLIWEATGWHSATRAARCGGGDPPESAGFDSFEMDRTASPAWAIEIFDGLSDAEQIKITLSAEDAEIDRRD